MRTYPSSLLDRRRRGSTPIRSRTLLRRRTRLRRTPLARPRSLW